ncbi:sulfite oxidase isoform X1 [Cryptomeria japonica]|uniref:sulfite oxidase isoform X1 n=3 Tax=Cryptomeria japonica TaxID=3369 RepID=UPI0027DA711E|nr:sulfite oxidase isoform X1 [Cryptomeria japonica]
MQALRGPLNYDEEPSRHLSLIINAKDPFNAETPRAALVESYVTPVDMFFKRNHGPIPILDDPQRYRVTVDGLVPKPLLLSMDDIRLLPKYTVTATLQCAGNRRTPMSKTKLVKGVGWDVGAVGNAVWGGAKLSDLLKLASIPENTANTEAGGKHVEFTSVDACEEENGGPYKASVSLLHATNPKADVLLAYEMNGKVLNRDHGYPLRVAIPGVIGARSVKWLDRIDVIANDFQGFFMQKDYKMFPPNVDWDNINWLSRRPLMDFPVQCVICSLEDVCSIGQGKKVNISGYALSGGGRGIERVDVSVDGGETWIEARRYQKNKVPYLADSEECDKWAWVFFELETEIYPPTDIIAKAVDSSANVQPEKVETIWNLRGVLNNSWHVIHANSPAKATHLSL